MSKGILVHATLLGSQILFDICVTTHPHGCMSALIHRWFIGPCIC